MKMCARKLVQKLSFLQPLLLAKRIGLISFFFLSFQAQATPLQTVNIYAWAYVFTPEIIQQFETETGIKVNLDVYDSAEVMETKLFTGHSGYDVVMVTVWPYLVRQVEAHVYQPLKISLIPNKKDIDPVLLHRMEEADPHNQFALPFIWGTNGFAYNKKKILERNPDAPFKSLAMLFNPEVVAQFADCGVMLIDSPIDVFPATLSYLKLDPNSGSTEDLKKATEALTQIRPFIKKFQPVPATEDLASGNYCLAQGFSGDLLLARDLGAESGIEIEYVIPEEGAALWVDALAIPRDAPNAEAAHIFINFILRSDIIAKITNAIAIANSVPASSPFLEKRIREDPLIYPSKQIMDKLYIDKTQSPRYERLRLREWTRVKIGR
ncbi:MAG: extracellular solute-binding protein [Proteobacteria bacterium]|nr:extracellular solute-binding protein [Pseudomonadota bacterium]